MANSSAGESTKGTRVIALVGPAGAGKTSLAEAMLFAAGATDRLGSTANGSSIGDSSPESRQRGGSTELNLYNLNYLGDEFAILDSPGSIGFAADGARAPYQEASTVRLFSTEGKGGRYGCGLSSGTLRRSPRFGHAWQEQQHVRSGAIPVATRPNRRGAFLARAGNR